MTFRGRGSIPYVETVEEQQMRQLWELEPFETCHHLLDSVLRKNNNDNDNDNNQHEKQPLLLAWNQAFSPPTSLSGYEDLFHALYDSKYNCNNQNHHDNNDYTTETTSLSVLSQQHQLQVHPSKNDPRSHFLLQLAYRGNQFCGWQSQPNNLQLPSIQKTLEDSLSLLFLKQEKQQAVDDDDDDKNTSNTLNQSTIAANAPTTTRNNVNVRVCGRTDAGVSAIGQIARFRTSRSSSSSSSSSSMIMTPKNIQDNLNQQFETISSKEQGQQTMNCTISTTSIRCLNVMPVTKAFHPTFTATCRAYAYLLDWDAWKETTTSSTTTKLGTTKSDNTMDHDQDDDEIETMLIETTLKRLNHLLQPLEGKALDFIGLSYGRLKTQTSICTLYHARATLVVINDKNNNNNNNMPKKKAMCLEFVGDRFLRRMVRYLVEITLRLVVRENYFEKHKKRVSSSLLSTTQTLTTSMASTTENGNDENENFNENIPFFLLQHIEKRDRQLIATPAPPDGLLFVGARFNSL